MTISPNPSNSPSHSGSQASSISSPSEKEKGFARYMQEAHSSSPGSHHWKDWTFNASDQSTINPSLTELLGTSRLPDLDPLIPNPSNTAPRKFIQLKLDPITRLSGDKNFVIEKIDRVALQNFGLTPEETQFLDVSDVTDPQKLEILQQYATMLRHYQSFRGHLVTHENIDTQIKPMTLLKIMKVALLSPHTMDIADDKQHRFVWNKDSKGIHIYSVGDARLLNSGTFGDVVEIIKMNTGERLAAKQLENYALHDAQNEMDILHHLHSIHKDPVGIAKRPLALIDIENLKQVLIMPKYQDGDLGTCFQSEKFNELSFKKKFNLAFQLIQGLHFLSSNGIIHGDLKSNNVMLDGDQLYIIDFGGSINLHNSKIKDALIAGVDPRLEFTTSHTPFRDFSLSREAVQKRDYDRWVQLGIQKDIFTAGVILFQMFTELHELPYALPKQHSELPIVENLPEISHYPSEMPKKTALILQKMLHPDPSKRPSSEEVLIAMQQAFNQI